MIAIVAVGLLVTMASAIDPRVAATLSKKESIAAPNHIYSRASQCSEIDPIGGSVPNQSYINGQDGCPAKNVMDPDGTCTSSMTIVDGTCAGYCEVRNFFFYGKEVPFSPPAHCSADQECSIQESDSATLTQTYTFNVNAAFSKRTTGNDSLIVRGDSDAESVLKLAFNLGASYSWSTSKTTTSGLTTSRPTNNNASDCGYWTVVPIFWQSCGTLTTAPTSAGEPGAEIFGRASDNSGCVNSEAKTTGNYCNTYPWKDSDGNNGGLPIFVVTGCQTNKLQPIYMQDPIYQYPGVAATPFSTEFQE